MLLVLVSLGSAAALGLTLVLEKRLLFANSCGSWAAFQLLMGLGFLLAALVTTAWVCLSGSGAELLSFPGLLSGLCFSGGFLLVVYGFRHAELSWCMALAYTYPLPAAALGWLFLGERVSLFGGLGILLAVLGGALVFLGPAGRGPGEPGREVWGAGRLASGAAAGFGKAWPALLGSTLLVAVGLALAREASADSGALALLALRRWGLAFGPLLLGLRPAALRALFAEFRARPAGGGSWWAAGGGGLGLAFLAFLHWITALAGDGLFLTAVTLGPVAAVGALSVSRVGFSFGLTILFQQRWPGWLGERLERGSWPRKAAALGLVMTGGMLAAFF